MKVKARLSNWKLLSERIFPCFPRINLWSLTKMLKDRGSRGFSSVMWHQQQHPLHLQQQKRQQHRGQAQRRRLSWRLRNRSGPGSDGIDLFCRRSPDMQRASRLASSSCAAAAAACYRLISPARLKVVGSTSAVLYEEQDFIFWTPAKTFPLNQAKPSILHRFPSNHLLIHPSMFSIVP